MLELEKINDIKDEEFNILLELKDIVKYCETTEIIESGLNKPLTLLMYEKIFKCK